MSAIYPKEMTDWEQEIRRQALKRDNYQCQKCKTPGTGIYTYYNEIQGLNLLENISAICEGCRRLEELKDLIKEALQAEYQTD